MPTKKLPRLVPASKPPTPFLFQEVKPDWSGLFAKLSDFDLAKPAKWISTIHGTFVSLFKLKPRSTREEAFLLVKRALAGAVADVIAASLDQDQHHLTPVRKEIAEQLDAQLSRERVELDSQFFTYPGRARVVGTVAKVVASWLRETGLGTEAADSAVLILPARFVARLNIELIDHADQYQQLVKAYSPRFVDAAEVEIAWQRYHVELHTQANPPVLTLGVSLEQVYVELRAYTELPVKSADIKSTEQQRDFNRIKRTVGMLTELAQAWMEDPADPIFVLSGGPGSGKSAFARRFAAWRAWAGPEPWRVLFVPLHRFKPGADLKPAISEFANNELKQNILLFDVKNDTRTLIIFDGLDELAQQGKVGEELAADFFRQVDDFVKDCNRDSQPLRVNVMLCGRSVAVSNTNAEVRKSERVRHILPYMMDDHRRDAVVWAGQTELLKIDQRDEWWAKYGEAIGDLEMTEMPPDICTDKLAPLTAEPILNGLIAKCRKDHKITPATNRAQIYEWLLFDVLKRVHDKSGKQHLKDAKEDDIAGLLEEVAVTAWHNGDVRATTKARVQDRCEKTERVDLLHRVFPDQQKSNVSSLFLAFYFQETGERQGQDRAFEFSHKSFGEYLLSRRIIGCLRELNDRLNNGAWNAEYASKRWSELFGPTSLNNDLCQFVNDSLESISVEILNEWRKTILSLLVYSIKRGMPMNQLGLSSFQEMERYNKNSIFSLFILHSACYRLGQPVMPVEWAGRKLQLDVLFTLHLGRTGRLTHWTRHLRGLDPHRANLRLASMSGANFEGADLTGADLSGANLVCANLAGANLSNALLVDQVFLSPHRDGYGYSECVDLRSANFYGANLTNVRFHNAILSDANIQDTNLCGAILSLEQLHKTIGEPTLMPDGKPPKKSWRRKRFRKSNSQDVQSPISIL